jgi:hypothetical protein
MSNNDINHQAKYLKYVEDELVHYIELNRQSETALALAKDRERDLRVLLSHALELTYDAFPPSPGGDDKSKFNSLEDAWSEYLRIKEEERKVK